MNGEAPATKQDLQNLRSELKQDIQDLRQDNEMLRSEMHHMYDNLVERMADSETKLLKAFYSYAEGNDKRVGQIETSNASMLGRLATVENRVLEIEKRLNLPPAQ